MPNTWSDFAQRARDGTHEPDVRDQLDGMSKIAARLAGTPFAQVCLATGSVHVVVGGTDFGIGPVNHGGSFYAAAMASDEGLIVNDAHNDPRFMHDPMVADAPHVRFFAGLPLLGSTGHAIGTLCVMDIAPHEALPAEHLEALRTLTKATMACLERWRLTQVESGKLPMPPQQDHAMNRRFETLADALPQLVWSSRSDGSSDYFSQQWCQFTGALPNASFGTGWLDFVHPDDVPIANHAWSTAIASGEPYTTEFRLRHVDGTYRWMLVRGLPVSDEFGRITRWIGTCTDIDERVRTGDLMEFMSRELTHRIKNLFAVVQGLISMALRKQPGMEQINQSLQARMVALGRAHDLIRPRIADGAIIRSHTTLRQLVEILTLPYAQDDASRLEIVGGDTAVDDRAATPLALFFHEMAINSARFGALSVPLGRLHIAIALGDDVTVEWNERNGPVIDHPPSPAFGLGLTKLSIERQLGGTLTLDWLREGLHATARIPLRQLDTAE